MPTEFDNAILRLGRVEDKFKLYEPMFMSLHGIVSIPGDMGKIWDELQLLKGSSISMKEQLTTLFKAQDRVYKDMVKSLEKQTRLLEKEIADCPIQDIAVKLDLVTKKVILIRPLEDKIRTVEATLESFKLRGWDLLFRIIPWVVAAIASAYALSVK